GKDGQTLLLYPGEGVAGYDRLLVVGLGKRSEVDAERVRRFAGAAVKQAARLQVDRLAVVPPVAASVDATAMGRAVAEGLELGSYVFDEFKAPEAEDGRERVTAAEVLAGNGASSGEMREGLRVGGALARGEV